MTQGLRATVLVDNHTLIDRYYTAEPALSILLESDAKKILFDTGYSDLFIHNADRMGINLLDLDCVVLSHGHIDHTGGLGYLIQRLTEAAIEGRPFHRPNLIGHPFCLYPRPMPPLPDVGSQISEDRAKLHFNLHTSREPIWITDKLVFLGEVPRKFNFEIEAPYSSTIVMPDGTRKPDLLLDDSAVVYKSKNGLAIFTGCSHSGICNIIEYAREICRERKILDIIGGLHLLKPASERIKKTCDFMKDVAPVELHACHCTSIKSLIALSTVCQVYEVGVGLQLMYR